MAMHATHVAGAVLGGEYSQVGVDDCICEGTKGINDQWPNCDVCKHKLQVKRHNKCTCWATYFPLRVQQQLVCLEDHALGIMQA